MMYTFGVLLLMGAHVFTILAQDDEELIAKSEEENAESENVEEEEEEEEEEEVEEEEDCDCPPLRRPVCGNNGITYANKCSYKCAADRNPTLRIKYLGACDDTLQFLIKSQTHYAPKRVRGL